MSTFTNNHIITYDNKKTNNYSYSILNQIFSKNNFTSSIINPGVEAPAIIPILLYLEKSIFSNSFTVSIKCIS